MMARFSAVMLMIFLCCCCECWDDETDGVGSVVPRLLYQISHALRACRVLCSIPAASARSRQELQKSHLESRRKQGDGLMERIKIRKAKEEEVHRPQSGLIGGYANFFCACGARLVLEN